jgi:chromate transporter
MIESNPESNPAPNPESNPAPDLEPALASRWPEVLALAVRLGFTAFGGPAAHIAMLRHEVITRRGWQTESRFLDLLGLTNLIPGPNSTEMVMHAGLERAGWRGLLAAGFGFILPAAGITLALAVAYKEFGSSPQLTGILYGVKPVVIAVVAQAIWGLGQLVFKSWTAGLIVVLVLIASLLGGPELPLLFVAAALFVLLEQIRKHGPKLGSIRALEPVSLAGVFWLFLKIGGTIYGSGYVLLSFLRGEFVSRGWITQTQLLDAISIGQVTPGPVFSSATFVGYLIAGYPGAILATVAIFGPAFLFVAITGPLLTRLRNNPISALVLNGLNAAALGLMLAVTLELARSALIDGWTVALALVSALALLRFKINSSWLVLCGAILGLVLKQ